MTARPVILPTGSQNVTVPLVLRTVTGRIMKALLLACMSTPEGAETI